MAALQCVANPPDCGQESVTVASAVDSYVAQLNGIPTPTTDGVCMYCIIIIYLCHWLFLQKARLCVYINYKNKDNQCFVSKVVPK